MEMQGTQNSKNNLKKGEWGWRAHTSQIQNFLQKQTNKEHLLQGYSKQDCVGLV